jgi:hypothetical protein
LCRRGVRSRVALAALRTRKPVLDYPLSRASCPHGAGIVITEALKRMLSSCLRFVCLFLLISGTAFAQTAVEGTVHDTRGRPVPNAFLGRERRSLHIASGGCGLLQGYL